MSNYKNPFEPGGKFYNPRITDASRVTEPRIMPRWAEQTEQQQTTIGTKFYDINTGVFIEQVEDSFTQIISIEKTKYIIYTTVYESISFFSKNKKGKSFTNYIINSSKNDSNFHILTGLTSEELNVRAFLATLRYAENAGPGQTEPLGYNAQFGGGTFTDKIYDDCHTCYANHPNKAITAWGYTSTAAGAYQFLSDKWKKLNLPSFSPVNQDKGALMIIKERDNSKLRSYGVVEDILSGNISSAAEKLNGTWTSLPGGPQEGLTKSEFLSKFKECLINELKENSILYSPIGILKL